MKKLRLSFILLSLFTFQFCFSQENSIPKDTIGLHEVIIPKEVSIILGQISRSTSKEDWTKSSRGNGATDTHPTSAYSRPSRAIVGNELIPRGIPRQVAFTTGRVRGGGTRGLWETESLDGRGAMGDRSEVQVRERDFSFFGFLKSWDFFYFLIFNFT